MINAMNLSLYSYVESIFKLGSQRKPVCGYICLYTLYPVALVSLVTFVLFTVDENLD